MKNTMLTAGCLAWVFFAGSAQAADFPVQGTSATGKPGDSVFVTLDYDYGASFGAITEDFQFEYQFAGMTYMPEKSTFAAAGASPQNMPQYMDALRLTANVLGGVVLVNPDKASPSGHKGYAMSFYTDGRPQARSGHVILQLAFDILPAALPGIYSVSFTDKNVLVDVAQNEYSYPIDLQHLSVTVVPEPQIAWMLLPGLALVGLYARRRTDRRL